MFSEHYLEGTMLRPFVHSFGQCSVHVARRLALGKDSCRKRLAASCQCVNVQLNGGSNVGTVWPDQG